MALLISSEIDFTDNIACVICSERLNNVAKLVNEHNIVSCEHVFHQSCIDEWASNAKASPTCPTCQQPFVATRKHDFINNLLDRLEKARAEKKVMSLQASRAEDEARQQSARAEILLKQHQQAQGVNDKERREEELTKKR
jgi:hypothetical protein